MEVFVGYRYDPNDEFVRRTLSWVDTVLRSFSATRTGGEAVGGGELPAEIKAGIEAADGVVSLFSAAAAPAPGANGAALVPTSEWVRSEYQYATDVRRPAIAIVFPGVEPPGGVNESRERIHIDPADPAAALLKLVQTIGKWRQQKGRTVRVRIQPPGVARTLGKHRDAAVCHARLSTWGAADAAPTQVPVKLVRLEGGTFAVVPRVTDESLIQIRAALGVDEWESKDREQWFDVRLEPKGGRG